VLPRPNPGEINGVIGQLRRRGNVDCALQARAR
jgi:hypothetical protein